MTVDHGRISKQDHWLLISSIQDTFTFYVVDNIYNLVKYDDIFNYFFEFLGTIEFLQNCQLYKSYFNFDSILHLLYSSNFTGLELHFERIRTPFGSRDAAVERVTTRRIFTRAKMCRRTGENPPKISLVTTINDLQSLARAI